MEIPVFIIFQSTETIEHYAKIMRSSKISVDFAL
jgi:hypothetical protein